MKRILILLLCLWLASPLSAQQLYQLWKQAGENVVINELYFNGATYADSTAMPVIIRKSIGKWSPPEGKYAIYRDFAEGMEKAGFKYDHQNDTLCFVFNHNFEVPNRLREAYILVASQHAPKQYGRFRRTNEIKEVDAYFTEYESLNKLIRALYDGNTDLAYQIINDEAKGVKAIFDYYSMYYALRIIISDGKTNYPSQYWIFELL